MKTRSGKFRRVNELYNKQAPVYTLLKAKKKKLPRQPLWDNIGALR